MTIEFGPYFWAPETTLFCDCCNGSAAQIRPKAYRTDPPQSAPPRSVPRTSAPKRTAPKSTAPKHTAQLRPEAYRTDPPQSVPPPKHMTQIRPEQLYKNEAPLKAVRKMGVP